MQRLLAVHDVALSKAAFGGRRGVETTLVVTAEQADRANLSWTVPDYLVARLLDQAHRS